MERMPKNIRQIGGREDRIKAYVEDYVSTYLRKLQEEREETGAAGMLVGEWQTDEKTGCVFINGAVEMKGADISGGRLLLTEEAWNSVYGSLGTYFSGQELCGIFVCEGTCRRFGRQALFAAVRESFPDNEEALLYILSEDGEEFFYRITRRSEERLQGYYCYFERNEAMQEYMMDNLRRRQVEKEELPGRRSYGADDTSDSSAVFADRQARDNPFPAGPVRAKEGSLGDPAESFRERMKRQQEEKASRKSGRGIFSLCAAMAVIVFASGLLLMQKEKGGVQVSDILDSLRINASELLQVSARPDEGAGSQSASDSAQTSHGGVVVEEIPGNVYPTDGDAASSSADVTEEVQPSEVQEESTGASAQENTQLSSETAAPETTQETPETAAQTQPETTQQTEPEQTAAASAGVTYVVQAGDSLYSISRRFYGTEAMVSKIQELNNLTNADLIKAGQTLILP